MNTTIHPTNKVCLIAFFLLVTISNIKADQLIWTGSVSKSWDDGDNWSTGKVPTPSDTVTIETGSNDVNLDKPVKVKMFTMSSGLLDMQTYDLMVTSKAVFQSGEILNGNVIVTGTGSATFSGTLFNAKVNISTGSVFLNGSVFNDSLLITKKEKTNDLSKGGNIFGEAVLLTDSGDGAMVLADSLPDVFKQELIVTNVGEGAIYLAHRSRDNEFYEDMFLNGSNIFSNYYGTAIYAGNIFIDSPNGEIYFGVSEGSCTLNYGKKLSTPISTISAGKLFLRNFYSLDSLSTIKLDLGGSAQLYLETGTVFHDKVSFTSPSLFLNGATFNNVADFTNTGNSNVTSTGGCTFAKAMTLTKSGGATKIYSLSNTVQDTYNGSATFENTSGTFSLNNGLFKKKCILKSNTTTGEGFYIAGAGSCTFKDSIVITKLDGPGMFFGGGNLLLDSASNLYFSNGIGGTAAFQKLTRAGTAPINIENGPDNLYLGPNNTINSNFSYTGKTITLYNNTFQGTTTIKVNGNTTTSSYGGNVFNGTTLIQDSSSTAHSMYLATGAADDYNGDVTFVQKGTGVSLYPAYTKNSTFAKNITLDGTTSVQLGGSGGKVILDGTTAQSITRGNTSLFPTIKKLQVNKATNSLTLNTPLTVSDSLQLTQGRINTDTTNLLTIAHGGKVTGGSDNNYINGPMKKIGNTAFAFPLGSSSLIHPYHPLEITAPTSTTDAYTAIYIPTAQTIGTAIDTSIDNLNACQYWKLNRNSGTSKVKVKLGWNHDSCETISPINFRVTGWNGTIWKDLGNSVTSGDSLQGMVQSTDSLNTITTLTLAFRKCAAFRKTVNVTNVRCKGGSDGSVVVSSRGGTENYSYLWSNGIGARSIANNLRAGKYYFQTSDSRGCVIADSAVVVESDSIVINSTHYASSCGDSSGSIVLNPNGGEGPYRYYWPYNGSKSYRIDNIPAGKYFVLVTDTNGCRKSKEIFVDDDDGPGMNILSQTNLTCFEVDSGSVEIEGADGKSPFKYQWARSMDDTSSEINFLRAGLYPVQITNIDGCITFDTIEITQPDTFGLSFQVTNTPCGSSTGQIIATPYGGNSPYSYNWINLSDTDSIVSNLSVGTYLLYVIDVNGCTTKSGIEVLSSSGFSVSSEVLSNVICFPDSGGSARVIISGGTAPYTFEWLPMGGSNDTATGLMPGTYIVTATDANGCIQKTSFNITGKPQILANLYPISPSDQWSSDGYIESYPTGGNPPYQYLWNDSSTASSLTNLPIGKYSVRITDQNGCMIIQEITLKAGTVNCFGCSPIHENCDPYYSGPAPCNPCSSAVTLSIADFGADGSDDISDECAFEEAAHYLSLCDPDAIKTLNIPSGTYYVGYQEGTADWLKLGATVFCLEGINKLTITGDVLAPKPIIRMNECMKYGAFIDNEATNSNDRFLSDFPGRLIHCIVTGNTVTTTENISWMNVGDVVYDSDPNNVIINGPRRDPIFTGTYVDAIISPTEFTIITAPYFNGDFDLRIQTDCKVVPVNYTNVASMGQFFHFTECNDITINYLELDGNMDNVVIGGGYYDDGIQVDYDGIVVNACNSLTINDVDIHHFGHDGLWINYMSDASCPYGPQSSFAMNCNIYNTTSRYNGRNALSWTGGDGLSVFDSDFSFTGQSRIVSQPGAGMDIEYELSNNPNANGYFENTTFRYNKNHGVICDALTAGVAHISRNYEFVDCTFIGSENGDAVWPNSRNFLFRSDCNFVGKVWNPFPVIASSTTDPIYLDNTKFLDCTFDEEYDEVDPDVPAEFLGRHYFSMTPEETEVIGGARVIRTYCGSNGINSGIGEHHAMVDFYNASRVLLENCTLRTNLTNKLLNLGLGASVMDLNYNEMRYCYFESRGLNFIVTDENDNCTCDHEVISLRNTALYGINMCRWVGPTRPDPTGMSPPPCVGWQYWSFVDFRNFITGFGTVLGGGNFDSFPVQPPIPSIYGVFWDGPWLGANVGALCPKFIDRADPNSAMPLYSTPCQDIQIGFPTQCSQSQRPAKLSRSNSHLEANVFPNPVLSDLNLKDLLVGTDYTVSDILGNVLLRKKAVNVIEKINLSFLNPGVYLITINNSTPQKIIKQ